ncbi:MAG: CoA transferase [Litorilinea sp.]
MTNPPGALQGIRILDFSHVFQGPLATQLLADYGADVIKIERPGAGDWSRSWGPFVDGVSMPFANLNRNKRSLALNTKHPTGKALALKLVAQADVLVHNFRSGVMEKLGLGYADLQPVNPRLIYAASSGWGDHGPYAERGRGGHDLMARAEGGWFYQADSHTPPTPAGISIDYPAGLMLGQAILMALLARAQTGQGQYVTTDLLSVAFHAHSWIGAAELNHTRLTRGQGVGATEDAIEKSFRTQDGWIEVSPVFSDDALRDISVALGLGDLAQDERFREPAARLANRGPMNELLAQRFAQKTTDEWIAELEPKGVLCGKIQSFAQAAEDPQIAANNMIVEMDHPQAGALRVLGTPARLHGTPPTVRIAPPRLGEHSTAVAAELGYSPVEIDELLAQGVIEIPKE